MAHDRYSNLVDAFDVLRNEGTRNVSYLEVGTHSGQRTATLCKRWKERSLGGLFSYIGFDLFEEADVAKHAHEFLKSTAAPLMALVEGMLRRHGASVVLHKGDTRITLPAFVAARQARYVPDIVFIDGGHSIKTTASDWAAVSQMMGPKTVVLFDDYFVNETDVGCQQLIKKIRKDKRYKVKLLEPIDYIPSNGLRIQMVEVRLR